jgi:hypothetical protein
MFSEWEKELQQYSNPSMAEMSRKQLRDTKARYTQLSRTVRTSEDSMKPVLAQLKDHVLFLKHNLNAAAIGSLKGEDFTNMHKFTSLRLIALNLFACALDHSLMLG